MVRLNPLGPIRAWLDAYEVESSQVAHWICWLIPNRCPFARSIPLGRYQLQIPPLCGLNPFYAQFLRLRCRALLYLAGQQPGGEPSPD
jgi:hypothetical protein